MEIRFRISLSGFSDSVPGHPFRLPPAHPPGGARLEGEAQRPARNPPKDHGSDRRLGSSPTACGSWATRRWGLCSRFWRPAAGSCATGRPRGRPKWMGARAPKTPTTRVEAAAGPSPRLRPAARLQTLGADACRELHPRGWPFRLVNKAKSQGVRSSRPHAARPRESSSWNGFGPPDPPSDRPTRADVLATH